MEKDWYKKTVIYQIYPRSYKDSNNDGYGDIRGIIEKLDYLEYLGIGAIWLSPVFKSPQKDNGYDISDYQDIEPLFGNLSDMEELIAEADKHGIKIIMDLVLNHSSNQHKWFLEAIKSKDNPYHDYYVFRDKVDGHEPNDMRGVFGGSAWEWVDGLDQYYFHQFTPEQPDLNWENPKLRQELYDMINFWIEKGVGGFRLDVIDQIAKEPDKKITSNGPRLHEFIKELSQNTFGGKNLITVGEAWSANIDNAPLYSNPDGSELSMVFQFEHICLDQKGWDKWDLMPLPFVKFKQIMNKWQVELFGKGWNSLFWNNHDLPRIVSRWGNDKEYRVQSAKMLATLLHGMQGTPYIYQGEEIGMTNIKLDIDEYDDVEIKNMYKERLAAGYSKEDIMNSIYAKGRDNARTPMQWDDSENAGFTGGKPWLKVNENYKEINVKNEMNDPDSILNYYKELISLRKNNDIFADGKFKMYLPDDENIFAYERTLGDKKMVVVCNFYGNTIENPMNQITKDMPMVLSNYNENDDILRPYEARMYMV
ncbi:MAG: alpha-glucosidase [Eubacterium sp.]|nr:alpha-glucosidase [Eubacterium sp.]